MPLIKSSNRDLLKSLIRINGWLKYEDFILMKYFLEKEGQIENSGNLLEIGVYQGKSSLLIGKYRSTTELFEVCDIFDGMTDSENLLEISQSYINLSRDIFEKNLVEHLGYLPVIHECKSKDLPDRLMSKSFRFIHLDGSHLYDHVQFDLSLATKLLKDNLSTIVMDDFRAAHTPGVAAVFWESIISKKLVPIVLTESKAYLAREINETQMQEIFDYLELQDLVPKYESFLGIKCIRVTNSRELPEIHFKRILRSLAPPILINLLRKLRNIRFLGSE